MWIGRNDFQNIGGRGMGGRTRSVFERHARTDFYYKTYVLWAVRRRCDGNTWRNNARLVRDRRRTTRRSIRGRRRRRRETDARDSTSSRRQRQRKTTRFKRDFNTMRVHAVGVRTRRPTVRDDDECVIVVCGIPNAPPPQPPPPTDHLIPPTRSNAYGRRVCACACLLRFAECTTAADCGESLYLRKCYDPKKMNYTTGNIFKKKNRFVK